MENKTTVKRKVTTKRRKDEAQVMYIGPNLAGGLLQRAMVFKGGLPPEVNALFDKEPLLKNLFVPTDKLAEAEKELKTAGTLLNEAYTAVTNGRKEVTSHV